jgi:hypothetical protein
MRKWFLFILGVVLLLTTAMPLQAASLLEKDMVAFDKAYIPALTLTGQGKKAAAKKAMKLTAAEWLLFKKKHATDFKKNKADMVDLTIISQKIADAERTVRANGNLNYAHDILEEVRNNFLKIRQRNSIDYYIDYMTKFSVPMEKIVLTAGGRTPESLTDTMLLKIKDNFKAAKRDWENLQNASFDPALYSFDAKKDAQRQSCIKAETEAMNMLDKALEGGDKGEIIKAALGIKSNFISLFLMFGDFKK